MTMPDVEELWNAAQAPLIQEACGVYRLAITQTNDAGLLGSTTLTIDAQGTLKAQVWTALTYTITDPGNGVSMVWTHAGEKQYPFVLPLLGRVEGEDEGVGTAGRALIEEVIKLGSGSIETESARTGTWAGREVYQVHRGIGGGWSLWKGREENTVDVYLDPVHLTPLAWEVALDDPTRLDGGGKLAAFHSVLAVSAGQPATETLDVTGAWGPLRIHVVRDITYTRVGECDA